MLLKALKLFCSQFACRSCKGEENLLPRFSCCTHGQGGNWSSEVWWWGFGGVSPEQGAEWWDGLWPEVAEALQEDSALLQNFAVVLIMIERDTGWRPWLPGVSLHPSVQLFHNLINCWFPNLVSALLPQIPARSPWDGDRAGHRWCRLAVPTWTHWGWLLGQIPGFQLSLMCLCLKIAELQRPLPWSAEEELQQRNVFAQSN